MLATSPHTAPGLDGWSRTELYHWPDHAWRALTILLQRIEGGFSSWPQALVLVRVACIPKAGAAGAVDPLKWRPLSITPLLYRQWARVRAQDIAAWLEAQDALPTCMLGCRKGRSAKEGALTALLHLYHLATLPASTL